jgi:hypothetical protein
MTGKLNDLKDYLLAKYSEWNTGFANVEKPSGTDVVMDTYRQYVGIRDDYGNYFYIRSLKDSRLTAQARGCRVQYYERTTSCRIVAIMRGSSEQNLSMVLVDAITRNGHTATRIVTERTEVFFAETGNRNITDGLRGLTLVAVDFEVNDILSGKDCNLLLCECL